MCKDVLTNLCLDRKLFLQACFDYFKAEVYLKASFFLLYLVSIIYILTKSFPIACCIALIIGAVALVYFTAYLIASNLPFIFKKLKVFRFIMSNPYLIKRIVDNRSKFVNENLQNVSMVKLSKVDKDVIDRIPYYYKFNKLLKPLMIIYYILFIVVNYSYIFKLITFKYSFYIMCCLSIILLTLLALSKVFNRFFFKVFYKGFIKSITNLYDYGYLTPLQFKSICFYQAKYLSEPVLDKEDCDYILSSPMVDKDKLISEYILDYYNKLSNSISVGVIIFIVTYLIARIQLYSLYMVVPIWIIFSVLLKQGLNQYAKFIVNKANADKTLRDDMIQRMYSNYGEMVSLIIKNTPESLLKEI